MMEKKIINLFKESNLNIKKELGEGSSRIVFLMEDGTVCKVAKNKAGLKQNETEYNRPGNLFVEAISLENFKGFEGAILKTLYVQPFEEYVYDILNKVIELMNEDDPHNYSKKQMNEFILKFNNHYEKEMSVQNLVPIIWIEESFQLLIDNYEYFDYDNLFDDLSEKIKSMYSNEDDIEDLDVYNVGISFDKDRKNYKYLIIDGGINNDNYYKEYQNDDGLKDLVVNI